MTTLSTATFSPCRTYRYFLCRRWEPALPLVMFVGLNPSTADETRDDPTLRRCAGFARAWGFGGVILVNLFAYRASDPRALHHAPDPLGPENDAWLVQGQEEAALVVAAWGNGGAYRGRAGEIRPRLRDPHALAVNQTGQPAHPLFLRGSLKPFRLL